MLVIRLSFYPRTYSVHIVSNYNIYLSSCGTQYFLQTTLALYIVEHIMSWTFESEYSIFCNRIKQPCTQLYGQQ